MVNFGSKHVRYMPTAKPHPNALPPNTLSALSGRMASHPHDCPHYCCSDFANFADDRHHAHILPDLTNEIHPLLSHAKFPDLSNEGYLALGLALKLASRMLEDDRTVEWVVTMADGSIHADHDTGSEPGPECTFAEIDSKELIPGDVHWTETRLLRYPRSTPNELSIGVSTAKVWVTANMRQRSKQILHDLAELLEEYKIVGEQLSEGRTDFTETVLSPAERKNFPRACKAKITFSTQMVWSFLKHERSDDPMALAEQYMLARNFVHELAHLLSQAVNGSRREEVFYKNSELAEAGFDLENALFGGIVTQLDLGDFLDHPERLAGQVLLEEMYPSGRLSQKYSVNGFTAGQRASLDDFSVVRRVPWSFMTSMFTDRFWDEDVPRMGSGPIQSAKKQPSWVIKQVLPGESYVTSKGDQLVADKYLILTCNPLDQGLPPRVQQVLREISRRSRRIALHEKRRI